jgi:hypothetical protein
VETGHWTRTAVLSRQAVRKDYLQSAGMEEIIIPNIDEFADWFSLIVSHLAL